MGDYLGIDLHKTKSFVTRMTAQGQILEQVNLLHTTGALQHYMAALPADVHLAVRRVGGVAPRVAAEDPERSRCPRALAEDARSLVASLPSEIWLIGLDGHSATQELLSTLAQAGFRPTEPEIHARSRVLMHLTR